MLDLDSIYLAYDGTPVLEGYELTVGAGETVALLGPSGSGKSTILRVAAGIVAPDAGRVLIGGADVTAMPTHQRSVGMVFQDEQLFPHLDVAGNVGFGLKLAGVTGRDRSARVGELLALVGLAGFGSRRIDQLSGGEAKRVALARSLAPRPRVLLLDEPLTGLDRELQERLADEIAALLADTTALWVTHDRAEAARVATHITEL